MRRCLCPFIVGALLLGTMCSSIAADGQESRAAALVVINLDRETVSFAGTGDPFPEEWRTVDDRHVVEANGDLIPQAREAGLLIVYVLIARPGRNLNVFTLTPLLETLRARGIQRLLFSGLNTGFCVSTSSQWALRLGFEVTVVAGAHSGGTPEYAAGHNDYWPGLGIAVGGMDRLSFEVLCAPPTDCRGRRLLRCDRSTRHEGWPG
jgi:hypothetical protein